MPRSLGRNAVYVRLGVGGSVAIVSKDKKRGYAIRYYEHGRSWEYYDTTYRKTLTAAKALAKKLTG